MNHEDYKLIKNIFKAKDGLGFYCYNVFEVVKSDIFQKEENSLLDRVIRAPFFSDDYIRPKEKIKELEFLNLTREEHCSLLIPKIDHADFMKLDLDRFKEEILIYQMEDNWGEDLPVFKDLFNDSLSHLVNDLKGDESIFYLNSEKIPKHKKLELNYYVYHISVVIPVKSTRKVILIDYGLD